MRSSGRCDSGDAAVFYYSGHGFEVNGENHLLPVDSSGFRSTSATEVQARMEEAGAEVRIMILDTSRNDPFARRMDLRGGLRQMSPRGGLVAFSTEAGAVASDDGLYTRHLVDALREPGLEAAELFARVSETVAAATEGRQVPAVSIAGAAGRFVFRRDGDPPPPPDPDPVPTMRPGDVFRDCVACPEMVVIPAGTFMMGSPSLPPGGSGGEAPRRSRGGARHRSGKPA